MTEGGGSSESGTADRPPDSDRPIPPRALGAAIALAVAVLLVAAVGPSFVEARPANQIPVERVSDDLSDPTADGWDDAPPVDVPLASAPSGVPNADSTSVEVVHVRAARTDDRLFVRLAWPDATADRSAAEIRGYADAAAVQIPANASVRPAIAMGSSRNHVNVWYWSGPTGTQELLAGGAGTTTAMPSPSVDGEAARITRDGEDSWAVTFSRALDPGGEHRTAIGNDDDLSVAFGVWNGSEMERSGRKAVSDWHHFPFGPGPSGPPYEAILWAVAGIAVVAVLVVTAYGIRRASEGAVEE